MASSLSAFSLSTPNSPLRPSSYTHLTAHKFQFPCVQLRTQFKSSAVSSMVKFSNNSAFRATKVRAVTEEEEILVPEEGEAESVADQTVSVSVSSSDVLTMFFQAEGTMSDSAIPAVTKGLEVVDGIADLKVQVLEGIASVELKKQTTVQATGVASNLVEIIQGSGFKLQTLNLSFQDEEDFA